MSSSQGWNQIEFNEINIGDRLGGGGLGIIYKGLYKNKNVAIKTLFSSNLSSPEDEREFLDEILVMSRLNHSNIVTFIGACMTPPNCFFVMELCETSLYNILHESPQKLSKIECIQAAVDIASAIEYLHHLNPSIVHRDLKTQNILRSLNGVYKLCDFGLVKCKVYSAGTPSYMSPELIDNRPYSKSSDIWAFGVILWEIFTGKIPHHGMPLNSIYSFIKSGKSLQLSSYSNDKTISKIISDCFKINPDERPYISDIVDELIYLEKNPDTKSTELYSDCFNDKEFDIHFTRK